MCITEPKQQPDVKMKYWVELVEPRWAGCSVGHKHARDASSAHFDSAHIQSENKSMCKISKKVQGHFLFPWHPCLTVYSVSCTPPQVTKKL